MYEYGCMGVCKDVIVGYMLALGEFRIVINPSLLTCRCKYTIMSVTGHLIGVPSGVAGMTGSPVNSLSVGDPGVFGIGARHFSSSRISGVAAGGESVWAMDVGCVITPIHIHPYTHTPIHPYTHTPIHPYTHTPIHPYTHTPIHPYTHTPIHPA